MAGTVGSGLLAYIAVTLSARLLGASEFGLLGAILAISSAATVLLRPLSYAATQLAAALHTQAGAASVRGLGGLAIAVGSVLAVFLPILLAAVAVPIGAVLQTTDVWTIVSLGPLIAAIVCLQLMTGILAGAHRFTWLAATLVVDAAIRALVIGPLAVLVGVSGAVAAYAVGQVSAVGFSIACLGGPSRRLPTLRELFSALRVGTSAALLLGAVAMLQHGDLLLLRWYGRPEDAGLYAACATIGNLFITLAGPLFVPAFSRALVAHRGCRPTLPILLGALTPIVAAGVFASLAAIWLGNPIAKLLFGAGFDGSGSILPAYLAKTTALVVSGTVGQHSLATARGKAVHWAFVPALLGLATVVLVRPGPVGAAVTMFVAGAVLATWIGIMTWVQPPDA